MTRKVIIQYLKHLSHTFGDVSSCPPKTEKDRTKLGRRSRILTPGEFISKEFER